MTDDAQTRHGQERCGFIAVIGAPNAGKSTLVNALIGAKVSIVTPKVQTTRNRVLGIMMRGAASQIVFVDTPGLFTPRGGHALEKTMVEAAWQGADDADCVLLIADASRRDALEHNREIIQRLSETAGRRPVFLALNKIDKIPRETLLKTAQKFNELYPFAQTFMISALKEDGLEPMAAALEATLPEGPLLFPEDQISDMPMRMLAAEITREKLFLNLHKELPYGIAVVTESWEESTDAGTGAVAIRQMILTSRDAHKPMILGKGGARIKAVGIAARKELEDILGRRVNLRLFVKVEEKWQHDPARYI